MSYSHCKHDSNTLPHRSQHSGLKRCNLGLENETSVANQQQQHRGVHFSHVTVREYEIVPSDSPAVLNGAGIELGWKYLITIDKSHVDDYENSRRTSRKKFYHLMPGLTPNQRRLRLSEFGYSAEEIDEAASRSAILRKQKQKSVARMRFDRVAELMEDIGSGWRRIKARTGVHREKESNLATSACMDEITDAKQGVVSPSPTLKISQEPYHMGA